jgi:hypothetical protein
MGPKIAAKTDKDLTRIITPEFRVSYPHVFKPHGFTAADKKKYSITMLFRKDLELIGQSPDGKPRSLKDVMTQAKIAKFGPKEEWPDDIRTAVVNGDDPKFADKDGYKGCWVIKASSFEDNKPSVVDHEMNILTNEHDLYPGCFARAYIQAYCWDNVGGRGLSFSLEHVQKIRDGKSFGGKKAVQDVFSPIARISEDSEEESVDEEDEDFK